MLDVDHALPHGMKAQLEGIDRSKYKKEIIKRKKEKIKEKKEVKGVTKLTDKPRIPP